MSEVARQSTAYETSIGPVLDADGVAVTDCVVADFKIKKTTGNFAALNGSATLTHVSAGTYDLVLTTSDMDTVGRNAVAIDDGVNACSQVVIQVLEEDVYDYLYASGATGFLRPTTAGRTLDVSATGEAGIDLDNIKQASGATTLSNIRIPVVTLVDTTTTNTDMRGTDGANTATPLDAAGTRAAVGLATANLDTQIADLPTNSELTTALADLPTNSELTTALGTLNDLSASEIRTALGMASADLDTQLDALATLIAGLNDLDAEGIRTALGLATANLDTQLADLPTVAEFNARTLAAADYATSTALGTLDTVADAIKVTTDKVDDTLEDDAGTYRFTTNALEQAPSGGGGGGGDATAANQVLILAAIGTPADTDLATDIANLQADVDLINAGAIAGAHNLVVTVTNSVGGANIQNARVRLYLNADDETKLTGVNGQPATPFTLDDGTWNYTVKLAGFTGVSGTKVISGADATLAVSLTALSITAPADPDKCTSYLVAIGATGDTESGVDFSCSLIAGDGTAGYSLDTTVQTATSDANGLVEFETLRGKRYKVWREANKANAKPFTVPEASTYAIPEFIGTP